jgi:CRISPR-associated endonuclease Csn1
MSNMKKKDSPAVPFILGLDVGANSVGWAVLLTGADGEPTAILAAGSRIFKAGVEGDLSTGRDVSRGIARRLARLQRRQTVRRARRKRRVYRVLMEAGLLPSVPVVNHQSIKAALDGLDNELRAAWIAAGDHQGQLVFPYQLRAAAAEGTVDAFALGRALYHLAQRRGFLSNRKTKAREDDEGVVKEGISALAAEMQSTGKVTLGAFFATLDPRERRIRSRYTHRSMFELEFDAIALRNQFVPPEVWKQLKYAMFFQRKLKSSRHLIGKCSCIPSARRAPSWHPLFQRYRILEQVANLRVTEAGATAARRLSPAERVIIADQLGRQEKMSVAGIKRALKLKGAELSIDAVGSGNLVGDRSAATMRRVFGERWDAMPAEERMQAMLDVHSYESQDALRSRALKHWKLDQDSAQLLADTNLEPSYAALSVKAIALLLPIMEGGVNAREAMDVAFPGRFKATTPVAALPPVGQAVPDLRNPAVARALTEVRHIVNRIVLKWGIPRLIRLELARDLKRGRLERERFAKENRDQQKSREESLARIVQETAVARPRRADIEKMLLAVECDFTCPYTGQRFGMNDLFGAQPIVDIEHIIPYSRSLDDSFANKTLCIVDENRNIKRQRTPFEAYRADHDRWGKIVARVDSFRGRHRRIKLEKFLMEDVGADLLEEFTSRQLNDTRYASRLAAQYVGRLFGGVADADGIRRVQVSGGVVTARLRQSWRMGTALHDDGVKNRDDHRHHALDAIAIALSSPAVVKRMADAASRGAAAGRDGKLLEFSEPWPSFLEHVKASLEQVISSHRVNRRLAGPLHEETNYSRPLSFHGSTMHRRRKGVESSNKKSLSEIADGSIRKSVDDALLRSAKGAISLDALPIARMDQAVSERVRHVRVDADRSPVELRAAKGARFVAPASNHHMAIFAVAVPGGIRWEGEVVTRLEAHRRKRFGGAIVNRSHGDGSQFLFTLRTGDTLRLDRDNGTKEFVVVGSVSGSTVEALAANDARATKDVRQQGVKGGRYTFAVSTLQHLAAIKVDIGPLGEMTMCHE